MGFWNFSQHNQAWNFEVYETWRLHFRWQHSLIAACKDSYVIYSCGFWLDSTANDVMNIDVMSLIPYVVAFL